MNDADRGETDLLACPFCGRRKRVWTGIERSLPDDDGITASWGIVACSCGAKLHRPTQDEAIAAWNRRARSLDSAVPDLEGG